MDIHLLVPTDIDEIPLKKYMKYMKLAKDFREDRLDELLLTVFYDLTPKQISKMKMTDLNMLSSKLRVVLEEKKDLNRIFLMDGIEWGFEPNLNDVEMSLFVDLDKYMADPNDMNKLMACLYRPIVKQRKDLYAIETYQGAEGNSITLMNMPLGTAMAAQLFFWTFGSQLIKTIPKSLKAEDMKSQQSEQQTGKNGDGLKLFTNLLKETSEISMKFLNLNFMFVYFGSQLKAMRQKL